MSVVRGFPNAGHYYSNIVKPIEIDIQFTVNNARPTGIQSLKSNGYVEAVFMRTTSATTATLYNPNAGYLAVHMKQNFNHYLGGSVQLNATSASNVSTSSTLTVGQPYIISSVGTMSTAQWDQIGLPPGFTPTIGQAFVATSGVYQGFATAAGTVTTPSNSSVDLLEVIGVTDTEINNSNVGTNAGAWVYFQFIASSANASVVTAPRNGTVVSLSTVWDGSSVTVDGL